MYDTRRSRVRHSNVLRETDESLVALSPYDRRLQDRTFYGIRDVHRPLATIELAAVQAMMEPRPAQPSLIETHPAGTIDIYV